MQRTVRCSARRLNRSVRRTSRANGVDTINLSRERFEQIRRKHGGYASWAVWALARRGPKSNIGDLSVLDANANPMLLQTVNPAVVMVGLNISRTFEEPFRNFHDPNPHANDFKLRAAFTGTPYYGAYMTDVVKNLPMVKSGDLIRHLRQNPSVIDSRIATFREELRDLGCARPTILAFGSDAYRLLHGHLMPSEYRRLVRLTHYSHYVGWNEYRETVLATLASSEAA